MKNFTLKSKVSNSVFNSETIALQDLEVRTKNSLALVSYLKLGLLFLIFLFTTDSVFAQPFIRTSGGYGQYGYIEKDAAVTNFLVGNGGYGNIFQYGVRTYLAGPNVNKYNYTGTGSCARGDDSTSNYDNTSNAMGAGNILYSSVFVEYCGPSYSCGSMTPTAACFNERSFFVMDLVGKTDALVSSACYSSTNSNVVLSFTISNNNISGQTLNRLWVVNDGTTAENTDIVATNDAFRVYYEAATGSETFNGTESFQSLYGNYGGDSTSNNEYGNNALGISIPQNSTGGLRCYVVLMGTSTYLNTSAKTKTVRLAIKADGINITPNRDTSFSLMKMDLTRPSTSFITINDTPTTSNAGADQTSSATCGLTSVTLAANTPTVGTGAWSIVSGSGGTITTPSSTTSTFSGTAGATYTLRWTITSGTCTSTDDVVVTFNQNPTASNAGADQTSSATCGLTSVTLAANTPTVGTGAWSIVSGAGGTVTTPSSNTSTFTGTAGTTYTLRWTISNSPCTASTDDVVITFNQNPTTSNAGADQTSSATCGLTSVTLAANAPTVGTGAWSIVSGAGGTVTTPSSNTSTFSGTAGTTYTLRWTISNSPCTASTDDVVITFNQNPTTSNAGADQTSSATCGLTSVTLAANAPTVGTGAWSIVSGSGGTVTTPSSNTSTFSCIAGTTYTLRWTISNSPCTASTDDVVITFNQNPTTSAAGVDQTICSTGAATLAGNNPSVGTGAWSVVSGPSTSSAQFGSASVFNTVFTPAGGAGVYTLRWSIGNSPCTASTDDVDITVNSCASTITTGTVSGSPFCAGATGISVSFTYSPSASFSGSIFKAQLSDASGSFASPTDLQTVSSDTSGSQSISVTIPSGTADGTGYRIRVVSDTPAVNGSDNGVNLSISATPTTSNAGADQTSSATCGLTSVTLAANAPTVGTGAWSIVSGAGGTVTTPSSNTSTFSGTAGTTYTLRWTISNSPCTASTDDVVITFNQNPTTSNAGADQTSSATCGLTSVTLAANAPTVGTGAWSIVSGSGGTVTTPSSNTSTFSGIAGTTYTLRWTISNSPCTASTDDVVITFNQNPTTSNAGADQTSSATCGLTSVTLAANAPTVGTGAWSIVSGSGGTVTTPSSETSTFSGTAGTTYTLRWTISNSPCTASTDDVVITFNQNPTTSNAGADQTSSATCGLTSVTLAANTPTVGTGAWSIVSGAGGTVTTPSSNTSTFSGTAGTTYTLRWTISNSPCTASTDDVVITFNQNPTTSNAGADQTSSATCGLTSVTLAANAPTVGTGAWSIVSGSGGIVTTPSSETSTFTGTAGTTYTLRWTISNSPCTASTDDVVITFNRNPTTATNGSTQTICTSGTATLSGNSPSVGTGSWSVISGPSTSSAQFASTSVFNTVFTPAGGAGSYVVRWTISNSPCTDSTADATLTVTASVGGTATATSSSVCLGDSTSITLSGNTGTIQWQRSENGGTSWTSISGATSSSYTTSSLNVTTSYRAVVTSGSCASANSTTATVSISEANQSTAGNATYNSTWSNGQNDSTTGFGAWALSASGGAGFFSSGSSDVNNANTRSWGMYAGGTGGGNVASATRTVSMGIGNKIAFSMDNGSITSGNTIGFGLQNASGQNLMELFFVGGASFYTLNDNSGANATTVGYTSGGLDVTVSYTAANTYSVTITPKGGATTTYTSRTFSTQGGGQLPAQIRFFNSGAGSGGSFDLFFNSLSITNPVITTQPSTGTQSFCIGATPTNLSVAASGSGLTYQWFSNATASNTGGTNLGSGSGAQTATYTPQNSTANTLYYYCVVTGGCSSTAVTTNVSGAITVNALPTPTFTAQPGASACTTVDVTYTTQSGQSNYIWTVPGVLNTDYSITSGGVGTSSSTVTLKWLTPGSKTVTINYTSSGCSAASATSSTATTVTASPTPTFTAQPGASACASTDVTYTTQSGQSNYIWTVPGVLNTDYSIISGGVGTGSNTVTLQWLTTGSKTVTVNYTSGGCSAGSATSSTATTVNALPTPTFTAQAGATACVGTDVTYTTQSGQSNYIWTVPGVLNTDYSITSGGIGTSSATVTLKWLTTGSKTVTINYTSSGCTAASATSSTATTVSALPTTATNGSAQTICSTATATLSGNTPSVGIGAWSVVSGPSTSSAQFDTTTSPTAVFTPAGGGGSYVVRWTITNGSCTSTADATITVTSGILDGVNLQYWTASPGAEQVCNGSSFTVYGQVYKAGLTNTTSGSGTGIEAQFGYNTSDTNPSGWTTWAAASFGSDKPSNDEYTYTFTPPSTGNYYFTFRYRLNGCAWFYGGYKSDGSLGAWNGSTYVNGAANVSATAPIAAAGSDISQCNNGTFTMAANAASPGTGTWTVVSGTATITSANSATTTITGVPFGTSATLRWTITNSPCSPTQDDIVVTNSSTNTWIGTTSTDWNTGANWCGGVPTSGSNVVIPSGTTFSPSIYQTANAVANSINIANGASLSMSNGYSVAITSGGSLTTNSSGTFTAGDGAVNFLGSGTITGTIAFYDVNLSGLVSFSNAVTVTNRLRIATGGAVTTNSPTYGSGSLLQYFVGASYNRSLEWTTATSGAGYPANVQISTNGTNTSLNMLTTSAQCSGTLTIDSGNTLNTTSSTLTVIGNVLINGTISLGGDVYTSGNWTVGASATQTNNSKAVFFTAATGDQTVTKTGGGTVFFDYLIVDKATGGNVVIESATAITLNTATGRVLQLINAGGLDLNGRSLTLNNSGGSIYVNGARSIISSPSSPNGTIEINQYKFIGNNSGTGSLSLGATVTVNLNTNGNLDFGLSGGTPITTLNGILSINSNTGCFVNTNPPIYSTTSTLIYNSGGTRNRDLEWNATSGAGYPNDVIVQNQTTLEVANGSDTYRKIAGDLTILGAATTGTVGCANCSKFRITDLFTASPATVSGTTGVGVEIGGDIINKGRIELKGDTNTRLKCTNFFNGDTTTEGNKSTTALSGDLNATPPFNGNYGGDLEVTADFQDDASFISNQRAVFFTGSGVQDVRGSAPGILNIDYVVVAKSGSTNPVLLNKELLIGGPQGGSAVVFYAATDVIDLNGFKLTVGTSGVYNTVIGDGKFKGGSNDSELSILGIGEIGTLNFDTTTPGVTNNLKYLTLNRTISAPTYPTAGFNLGSDVNISNTATLTAGTLNLGSANMTIGASASISVSSPDATKMIIASGTGELRKTFAAAGSFTYPIGDNVGTAEYSPATLTFSGSPSGYAGVRVQNAKHPNINVGITDYVSRYWLVSSTIGSPTYDASFTYLSADENGTPANYFGGRYLSSDWYCMDDVDNTSRIISKTSLSAFGDFTVYNPPAITTTLTSSASTICANASTNLQIAIGGGDSPYTVGPFTVVYYDSVLATNVTVNSYTSGANIPVSPTATTIYTLQSVTSSKACSSTATDTKTVTIGGTTTYALGSWSPSAPASTSTAVIDGGTYNAAADITACTLQVKNSAIVTIPSTYKVTLSGALTVESGSSFTLENDSNLVQTGGTTNPNTGSVQVKRNSSSLYLLDYTLWSSSVENQNLYSFSPDTAPNRFYIYDESIDQYDPLTSNNSFTVGRGYLIRVPRTFSATSPAVFTGVFTGKPNSGTISYAMSKSLNGYNAVGNPYPSQINVYNFIDSNISNISGTIYFWRKRNDPNATSYATLTKLAYAANAAAGGDTGSSYFNATTPSNWVLNVGQGFIVQATSASNVVFTNSMRRGTNNSNQFFRTATKQVEEPSTFKLNLTSTNGVFSQMVLGYSADYTLGVDDGIDGLNINSNNYLCSSIEGTAYAIQGRPAFSATDSVPLEYKIENADQYSIAIEQLSGVFAGQDVFLKDKLTNSIHDLKSGPYAFGSEAGNFNDRFEIVYENALAVNQSTFNENSVIVYKQHQELVINTGKTAMSSVKVYDVRGRLLMAKDHIDATQVRLFTGTTQEVLLVKITSDTNGTVTKKVVN